MGMKKNDPLDHVVVVGKKVTYNLATGAPVVDPLDRAGEEVAGPHSVILDEANLVGAATNPKDLLGTKKPPLNLVPPVAIIQEAMAFKDGAAKYGAYNWRKKPVIATIYYEAALRHLMAWFDGEEVAADSGVHHLAHARACLAILLDAGECGALKDNRPSPGGAGTLIERLTTK